MYIYMEFGSYLHQKGINSVHVSLSFFSFMVFNVKYYINMKMAFSIKLRLGALVLNRP